MTGQRPSTRRAEALFRASLRILPEPIRGLYEAEMRADFETLARDEAARSGARLWSATLRATLDVVKIGMVERGRRGPLTRWLTRWEGIREGMMDWFRELRMAGRSLARRPAFSGIAALTLGLGIGATVAIFAVVDSVLLRPLPFPESDRIVEVRHHAPGIGLDELNNSEGTVVFYQAQTDLFSVFGAFDAGNFNLAGQDEPVRVRAARFTPEIFDVLQTRPALGRPLTHADAAEGAPGVAILSHELWASSFGSDPGVLGQTIYLDDRPAEVVGIMPAGFVFPRPGNQVFLPLPISDDPQFGAFGMGGVGRLAPGMTLEMAAQRVSDLQARAAELDPEITLEALEGWGWAASVRTIKESLVGDSRPAIMIVLGTVSVLLLIALANVANLFLVRSDGRQREMAIRGALGAGSGRIARTYLAESALLGGMAGITGLALAGLGLEGIVALVGDELPRVQDVNMTAGGLGLTATLSLAAAMALGVLPMARRQGAFAETLRDGGRGSTHGAARHRVRHFLVTGQLALALVLLVGSGLLLRSFMALRATDVGFDGRDVVTVGLSFGEGEREAQAQFYRDVIEGTAALPGVTSVGASAALPLISSSSNGGSFHIEGEPEQEGDLPMVTLYKAFTPGYAETLGIELLAGRPHTWSDLSDDAQNVWVNREMADQFLGGVNEALGKRISVDGDSVIYFSEIVGVFETVKTNGIDNDDAPMTYFPLLNGEASRGPMEWMALTVEAPNGPTSVVPAIRELVRAADPRVPVTAVRTMDDIRSEATADTSVTLILLGIVSGMALLLGAIGLYGVISYTVSQRIQEIGVRMALGADRGQVQGMVLRQSVMVTAGGVILGLLGAFALSRVMATLLFGVSATDPVTFLTVPVVLALVSVLSAWLPARRASRVDPALALRAD
jgi:predicted permease